MSNGNPHHATANMTASPHWSSHALGQQLCQQEQLLYDDWVSNLFGYHALQLGDLPIDLLRNSRIQHRFHAQSSGSAAEPAQQLYCDSAFLPFPENSLDLLLLPHVLEFTDLPQQSLREVERVLVPEGHVILTLFNPYSPWGVKRALGLGKREIADLWSAHFFSMSRIKDCLSVLGFEVLQSQMLCHQWPIHSPIWAQRLSILAKLGLKFCPMTGGVYAILARKRVTGMHIIRPDWQALRLSKKLLVSPNKKQIKQSVQSL